MKSIFAAIVAGTLVLATIACSVASPTPEALSPNPLASSPVPPSSPGPTLSPTRIPLPSGIADAGVPPATLIERVQVAALGRPGNVRVRGSAVYWTAEDRPGLGLETGFIVEWRPPARPQVLLRATRPRGLIQDLYVSDDWIAWVEFQDRVRGSDMRVYAMGRDDTQPTLIDDVSEHGPVATFPEMTLDGADLYWTIPAIADGVWTGRLLHKRLPSGPVETVESGDRQLFTWPRAYNGSVAYEVVHQDASTEYRVRYRTADGKSHDVDVGQASEPAIGPGYLVFKASTRYEVGDLKVLDLRTGATVTLGSGEAPEVSGDMITWFDTKANEGKVARARDGCTARYTANRSSGELGESAGTLSGSRLAWPFLQNVNGTVTEFIRAATLSGMPC